MMSTLPSLLYVFGVYFLYVFVVPLSKSAYGKILDNIGHFRLCCISLRIYGLDVPVGRLEDAEHRIFHSQKYVVL